MKRAALALATAVVLAGCAGQNPSSTPLPLGDAKPKPGPVNLVPDGYQGRFRIVATVLQNAHHGPQLCQAVADSLPPQCGGPDIVGWTWTGLKAESVSGTTWGVFVVTGTFDEKAGKLTLTEPAKADDGTFKPKANPTPDFTSPCKAPEGGWKPVDAAKATNDALEATHALVNADPDFAGLWIDETPPPELATPMNNPARLVLNVRFTKDLSRHEAEIRKVWGGALCVSKAERTEAELRRIHDELSSEPGMAFASTGVVSGTVEIGVFLARQSRQNELDVKYGTGVVTLIGALQPID